MILTRFGPKKEAFFLHEEKNSSYLKSSSLGESTREYKTCQCTPPSGTLVHHITHVPLCWLAQSGEDAV